MNWWEEAQPMTAWFWARPNLIYHGPSHVPLRPPPGPSLPGSQSQVPTLPAGGDWSAGRAPAARWAAGARGTCSTRTSTTRSRPAASTARTLRPTITPSSAPSSAPRPASVRARLPNPPLPSGCSLAFPLSHLGLRSRSVPDDPFGDPKATGDPYCTVFVGRLSRHTDDDTLREVPPHLPPSRVANGMVLWLCAGCLGCRYLIHGRGGGFATLGYLCRRWAGMGRWRACGWCVTLVSDSFLRCFLQITA